MKYQNIITKTLVYASIAFIFTGCASLKRLTKTFASLPNSHTQKTSSISSQKSSSKIGQKSIKPSLSRNSLTPTNISDSGYASQNDIKLFLSFVRLYDTSLPQDVNQSLFFVKEKIKKQIPIKNSELVSLKSTIQKKCKKIKKKSIQFARVRALYLLGDTESITLKIDPLILFFNNTNKYLPKPITLKRGEAKLINLPPGFYNIIASAKFKQTIKQICVAMEDDDFQCYYITSSTYDQVKAIDPMNTVNITNSDGYLYVRTKDLEKIFSLSSELPFLERKQEWKPHKLGMVEKALIEKYPALKDYYQSDITIEHNNKVRYISSPKGVKSVSLPAPILLQLPAGEYSINGKKIIINCDKLSILNL